MSTHAEQVLEAYRRYRVEDQFNYYSRQSSKLKAALRRTTRISALLLVMASLFGALGAVDSQRRGLWAFMAATLAALSTAIAAYETGFGFERLSREYSDTLSALKLTDAERPTTPDDKNVGRHVERTEGLLRTEVDSWSHLTSETATPPSGTVRSEQDPAETA